MPQCKYKFARDSISTMAKISSGQQMQFLMAIDLCRTENGRKRKKNECTAQTVTVAMWTQLRKKITIIMLHFLGTLFVFVHVVCVVSAYVSRMSFPFEFLPGGLLDIFLSFSSSRSPSYPLFYSSSWYARLIRPTVCVQFAIHPDECFDHLLFEGKKKFASCAWARCDLIGDSMCILLLAFNL